ALGFATRAHATDMVLAVELNLAFSLAELGRLDEAELHHATATALDRDKDYASNLAQLAARSAYRRGDLKHASSLNATLYAEMPPGDDRLEGSVMQARPELALEALAAAARSGRRARARAGQIRASRTAAGCRSRSSARAPRCSNSSISPRARRRIAREPTRPASA